MFEESVAVVPSLWESMNSWFTPTVLFVLLNVMIGTIALTSTLANQNKHVNQTENNPNKLARQPSILQRVRSINFYAYRQEHQQPHIDTKTFTSGFGSSDSNQFGVVDEPHKPETLEDRTHYLFEEPHQEISPEESDNQYDYYQQQHQENGEVMDTQYQFEQTQESSTGNLDGYSFVESGFHHLNQENLEDGEEEAEVDNEDADTLQSLEEVYSKVTGHHVRTKSDTVPSSGEVPVKLSRKMRKSASAKSAFRHFEAEDIVETRRPETVREKVAEPDEEVDAKADDFINKFKQQLKLQRIDSITRYKEMITRGR